MAESEKHLGFSVKRVFYILKTRKGDSRGFHSHKETILALFCLQGSSVIKLDDGHERSELLLSEPNKGVVIRPGVWHSMEDFAENTVFLALASEPYNESDYIRDYAQFKQSIKE